MTIELAGVELWGYHGALEQERRMSHQLLAAEAFRDPDRWVAQLLEPARSRGLVMRR